MKSFSMKKFVTIMIVTAVLMVIIAIISLKCGM
jgi:cell division protein FtsL